MAEIRFDEEEGRLSFALDELIEQMTYEEKMRVIQHFSMEKDIRDAVIDQLTGEDCDFYWSDDDGERLKILSALEDKLISNFRWSFIYRINDFIKDHASNKHLYWEMYHDLEHGEFFRQWMKRRGIESNYTSKPMLLYRFRRFLAKTFDDLKNAKEPPCPSTD